MLAYAPELALNTVAIVQNACVGADDAQAIVSSGSTSFKVLRSFKVGSAHYRFLKLVEISHSYSLKNYSWLCWAQEIGSFYTGVGKTLLDAQKEWENLVHADFQSLYGKRPFEMTEDERQRWELLSSIVDVLHYRQNTLLSVREIGCVRFGHYSYPTKIIWIDGRRDIFSLNQVPSDLASCKPGQWIEAIVERDPQHSRLIQITHIQKIAPIRRPSKDTMEAYWSELPKAELPERDWDWLR